MTAWFVAICFQPGICFNDRGAEDGISRALGQLGHTCGLRSAGDSLRVLLRFGLFEEVPGGHRYRMATDAGGAVRTSCEVLDFWRKAYLLFAIPGCRWM